jgi:hypothetical protein
MILLANKKDNIFLAHNMVNRAQMAKGIGLGVWAAIEAFQTSAMAPQP